MQGGISGRIPGGSLRRQGRGDKVGRGVAGGLRPVIQARSNRELKQVYFVGGDTEK